MPLINNPGNLNARETALFPHQRALIRDLLAAYQQDRREFFVLRGMGGSGLGFHHPKYEGHIEVQDGDLVALERAGMIDVIKTSDRGSIDRFSPTAFAASLVHPDDYLDLSDEAWAISKDTLRNRRERVRDVQRMLRGICDDPDSLEPIRETAQAADLLLGHIERYLDPGNPADEPLARVSTASLRALALTILRFGGIEVLGAAVEAFRELLDLLEP